MPINRRPGRQTETTTNRPPDRQTGEQQQQQSCGLRGLFNLLNVHPAFRCFLKETNISSSKVTSDSSLSFDHVKP